MTPDEPLPPAVRIAQALLAAYDDRDVEEYIRHFSEDALVRMPGFIVGPAEHRGREDVRAAFLEFVGRLGRDRAFAFRQRRYFIDRDDEDKVLIVVEMTASSGDGLPFGAEAAILLTIEDGEVARLESWRTEAEGLSQLEQPAPVTLR